jgi:hypothetical protein
LTASEQRRLLVLNQLEAGALVNACAAITESGALPPSATATEAAGRGGGDRALAHHRASNPEGSGRFPHPGAGDRPVIDAGAPAATIGWKASSPTP